MHHLSAVCWQSCTEFPNLLRREFWRFISTFPSVFVNSLFNSIGSFMQQASIHHFTSRVHTHHAESINGSLQYPHSILLVAIGSLFGAIHRTAWSSIFPSDVEHILCTFALSYWSPYLQLNIWLFYGWIMKMTYPNSYGLFWSPLPSLSGFFSSLVPPPLCYGKIHPHCPGISSSTSAHTRGTCRTGVDIIHSSHLNDNTSCILLLQSCFSCVCFVCHCSPCFYL